MASRTSSQAQFFSELRSLLRAPYPLIRIKTWEEDRAVSLLERFGRRDDRKLRTWSPVGGFGDGDERASAAEALKAVERVEDPGIFAFKGAHLLFDRAFVRRRFREIADRSTASGKTIVFITPLEIEAPELEKDIANLSMPLPDREVLESEYDNVFEGTGLELDRERVVTGALGLTAREAYRAFHRVRRQYREALERNALFNAEEAILSEKQRMIGESDVLEYHPLDFGLDDVGGLAVLKEWLEERRHAFGERARAYGLPMPKGLLLIGVQGCGKSLTAKAVARHWGMPLLRLDLGGVFDGRRSPEEALRTGIQTSEAIAPCVLWLDEIEKGFAGESGGRADRVLGSLLTWQQEKDEPVFLVATANEVEQLPPELLRKGRFDEIFFIDLPGRREREEILEIHLERRGRPFGADIVGDIAEATEFFSGAELEQVVVSAMYTAFADEREVAAEDLRYAAQETVPLYRTYEEEIKALREWAHGRARSASREQELLDYFG